jgi:hypothetical protein
LGAADTPPAARPPRTQRPNSAFGSSRIELRRLHGTSAGGCDLRASIWNSYTRGVASADHADAFSAPPTSRLRGSDDNSTNRHVRIDNTHASLAFTSSSGTRPFVRAQYHGRWCNHGAKQKRWCDGIHRIHCWERTGAMHWHPFEPYNDVHDEAVGILGDTTQLGARHRHAPCASVDSGELRGLWRRRGRCSE